MGRRTFDFVEPIPTKQKQNKNKNKRTSKRRMVFRFILHGAILYKVLFTASSASSMRVGVTGITGRLGREAVQILSAKGIETRCLLRHAIDPSLTPSLDKDASSAEVARFLSLLPSVTMVEGDATSEKSCIDLVKGCDAVCE